MKRRRLSTRELRTSAVSALAGKPVAVAVYTPVIFPDPRRAGVVAL
jgi:hypothetical protein